MQISLISLSFIMALEILAKSALAASVIAPSIRISPTSQRKPLRRSSLQVANAKIGPRKPQDRLRAFIRQERLITNALLSSNRSAFYYPFFIIGFARVICLPYSALSLLSLLKLSVSLWFLAFGFHYTFEWGNQATSVEEDAVNKPSRPIPAGLLTIQGAYTRWVLSWVCYPVLAYAVSGPQAATFAMLWEALVMVCYVYPKPNNPFARNLFNGPVIFLMGRLIDCAMTNSGLDGASVHAGLDAIMGMWIFLTIHLQEFHDVEGDRASGRRTLPLVLNKQDMRCVRKVTAAFIVASTGFVLATSLEARSRLGGCIGMLIFASGLFGLSIVTAWRVVQGSSATMDEKTYRKFYLPLGILLFSFQAQLNTLL